MKRGANVKIPQIEEIAATAAAIQNVFLGLLLWVLPPSGAPAV